MGEVEEKSLAWLAECLGFGLFFFFLINKRMY